MRGLVHETSIRGATNVWLTPKSVIDALGPFDLDPCAAPSPRPWPTAARHIVESENGLTQKWGGLVFCNPPYGPEAGAWVEKLADHGNGIALVFARTETKWFQAVAHRATSLFFPAGRFEFCRPDGTPGNSNAGAPSVFLAFGNEAHLRLKNSTMSGFFATPYRVGLLEGLI